jgi:hypothetical protein
MDGSWIVLILIMVENEMVSVVRCNWIFMRRRHEHPRALIQSPDRHNLGYLERFRAWTLGE